MRNINTPSTDYIQCYHYHQNPNKPQNYTPIRALFVTSIRDVGKEDRNGDIINLPNGTVKMPGLIETITHMINEGNKELEKWLRIVGIVTDDTKNDDLGQYSCLPHKEKKWIYDYDLRNERGELLRSITTNIPSDFRSISSKNHPLEKAEKKLEFENKLAKHMQELDAEILISDHLMIRIQNLIHHSRNLFGKVLNIHPAVTRGDYEFNLRGMTPTQDAIDRANGFKIRNNKRTSISKHYRTGATFHVVDEEIDAGTVLADAEPTIVYPSDRPEMLRYRNYLQAKIPVFIAGIRHYAQNIFPFLHEIDLKNSPQPSQVVQTNFPSINIYYNGLSN